MEKREDDINESQLIAYINGELSGDEKLRVERWIASSPQHKKVFDELEKTWILSGKISPKPVVVNTDDAWLKISQKITRPAAQKPTRVFKLNPWLQAAAVAVILVGVFGIYKLMNPSAGQLTLTAQNEILTDTLQDGSVVSLNKNSSLTYPDRFAGNERRVKLDGEAFFEVEPDAQKPFVVELNHQAQVTVLGTSFNIEEGDSTTEVFVKTGKVEFKSAQDAVILTPGQKGILHYTSGEITLANAEALDFNETYWLDQKLNFEKTNLDEVIRILSLVFETSIELENPEAGNCVLTTRFERESLNQILQVIATSFGLEVEEHKNGYILKGNGC
ncbi:MAG: FecR domain-containing protein [Bacteroidetes bacterium]|nr:FecR domain-containing protein [Bacteroidota bacterium]